MENGHAIKVLDYVINAHILMGLEVRGAINCGRDVKYLSYVDCFLVELWKNQPIRNNSELAKLTLFNPPKIGTVIEVMKIDIRNLC
jgi:hypothetical protein